MENILFVLFLLKKDVICTEIIIFATEIRKHMMNIAGRNSKEKTPPFFCCMVKMLEWERLRKMGTVAGTVAKKYLWKTLDYQRIS